MSFYALLPAGNGYDLTMLTETHTNHTKGNGTMNQSELENYCKHSEIYKRRAKGDLENVVYFIERLTQEVDRINEVRESDDLVLMSSRIASLRTDFESALFQVRQASENTMMARATKDVEDSKK